MRELMRIRYSKVGAVLRSFRTFQANGKTLLVEINPLVKRAYLLDASTNSLIKEVEVKGGLHKLKIQAKRLLEEAGVTTLKEDRKSRVQPVQAE
jgi:hypothetical protein